ncbi:MAG: protein kinase [Planctomycetes bacterium]|nr:protein kinase [Planctomycetota bacterium]
MTMDGTEALAEAMRVFDAWQSGHEPCSPEQLLEDHPHVAHLLAPLVGVELGEPLDDPGQPNDLRPGDRIGPYRLVEVVGEGGMGTVWLALQEDPVRRRVALKIARRGSLGSARARLEAERHVLGAMEHPNIARIHDAGVLDDGRPWFAMEFVEGSTLSEFCKNERLSIRQRLDLLVAICRGVHHAHVKGVVHRDLKPSNILVRRVDGTPFPKIIDFGVAKVLEIEFGGGDMDQPQGDEAGLPSSLTIEGRVLGTPAYMSPEQADPVTSSIDTRSDVYTLGVLLYELLTGGPPFEAQILQRGYEEFRRVLREVDPQRPSLRVTQEATRTTTVLDGLGGIDASTLTRTLRGDLDWITLRALEKDPALRYQSAAAFAEDLERYLCDAPVLARPPSASYQLRKFVKRNRVLVAGVGIALLSLVAGATIATWKAIEAEKSFRSERAARVRAEGLRASAQALAIVPQNPARALELAIEGAEKAPGLEATDALFGALAQHNAAAVLHGHEHYVRHVVTSPVAPVAVSSDDSMLLIAWDLEAAHEVWRSNEHSGQIEDLAFSNDGRHVATACSDGVCRVFRIDDGEVAIRIDVGVASTRVSFDGERLWVGGADGVVYAFAVASWDRRDAFSHHDVPVVQLVHGDGVVASIGSDQQVVVTEYGETAPKTSRHRLEGGSVRLRSGQFVDEQLTMSANGRYLAAKGKSRQAWIYDRQRHTNLVVDEGLDGACTDVAFSPRGNGLYMHFRDQRRSLAALVDVTDQDALRTVSLHGLARGARSPVFSRDGRYLACDDRDIRVLDTRDLREVAVLRPVPQLCLDHAFSHDGRWVVTASADKTLRTWRVHALPTRDAVLDAEPVGGVYFIGSGNQPDFVACHEATIDNERPTRVRSRDTGAVVAEILQDSDRPPRATFSDDGRWLLCIEHREGRVAVWDLREKRVLHRVTGPWTLGAFSPCGRWYWLTAYVQGKSSPRIEVRDRATGDVLLAITDETHDFFLGALDPDRGLAAFSAAPQGAVLVWNVREQRLAHRIEGFDGWTLSLRFLVRHGVLVVTTNQGAAEAWRVADWTRVRNWNGLLGSEFLATSPSEDLIAFYSTFAVHVFEVSSWREIARSRVEKPARIMGLSLSEADFTVSDWSGRSTTSPRDALGAARARLEKRILERAR